MVGVKDRVRDGVGAGGCTLSPCPLPVLSPPPLPPRLARPISPRRKEACRRRRTSSSRAQSPLWRLAGIGTYRWTRRERRRMTPPRTTLAFCGRCSSAAFSWSCSWARLSSSRGPWPSTSAPCTSNRQRMTLLTGTHAGASRWVTRNGSPTLRTPLQPPRSTGPCSSTSNTSSISSANKLCPAPRPRCGTGRKGRGHTWRGTSQPLRWGHKVIRRTRTHNIMSPSPPPSASEGDIGQRRAGTENRKSMFTSSSSASSRPPARPTSCVAPCPCPCPCPSWRHA